MTGETQKRGISAAQATIIAAIISGLVTLAAIYNQHVENKKPPNYQANTTPTTTGFEKTTTKPEQAPPPEVLEGIPGGTESRGCAPLGSLQICWGNAKFTPRNDPGTPVCDYAMAFARHFVDKPSVTVTLQGETTGYAYAVYSQQVTSGGVSGGGLEVLRRASQEPVVASYVAIGQPAAK